MTEKQIMTDVLIVGAGTAGLTAAVYAARAGKSVKLVEQYLQGGQIINASHVENFPGFESIAGFEFAEALYNQAIKMGAEIVYDKVTGLQDYGSHKGVQTEYGGELLAKAVILATGARVRPLGLENEDRFIGSGVSYCATCDGAFFKDKNVAVVGGGNTALDDALVLSFTSKKVYLIHRSDTFSGEKRLLEKLQEHDNVVFILDSEVTAINGSERLESLGIRNKVSGEEQTLDVDAAFIAIGHVPDNKAFASLVELDAYGYIKTDENCATSCPGIYAAGDGRVKKVRQLTTAAADGTEAALAACDYIDLL